MSARPGRTAASWASATRSLIVAGSLAATVTTAAAAQDDICARGPYFMIMHERPELGNRSAVDSAILVAVEKHRVEVTDSIMLLPWLYLDETGTVRCSQLANASPDAVLDSVAVQVGRLMRFTPARRDGTPVPIWVQYPVVLRPRGDPAAGARTP